LHSNSSYSDQATIKELLTNKSFVAIVPHKGPDGDAIGSALALKKFIQTYHNNVEIFCVDKAPNNTLFLNQSNTVQHNLDPTIYKTICFVDCGNSKMSKYDLKFKDLFTNQNYTTINIDHHQSNDNFADYNIVDTKSSSTCEILFNLFNIWNFSIPKIIAQDLQTGIHFDTGSFKHPNTTVKTLKVAAKLSQLGANNTQITKNLFHLNTTNQLKFWGEIFNRTRINQRKILSSVATQKDFKKYQASSKDLEGIIDYLNAVPDKKFSILITEDSNNGVKGSLRTQNTNYDLNRISSIFGGGGHKMAAGFRIEGNLKETTNWTIE
jgi:phosphoesterase RecJ-like protein